MIKLNKKLKKIVSESVKLSFDNQNLDNKKILQVVEGLKKLPRSEAILTLSAYAYAIKQLLSQKTLVIDSSQTLSQDEREQISNRFAKSFAFDQIQVNLDSSLLGGVRVKIGDYIYEDSIKSRIDQVREVLQG